ncbi:hypothetical protein AVEN_84950-1 [Araneus ventricosus]|uniref:Uncharacterized protein n=1 Tax=Araneus ventricosus TaxID=182803 RepID=A0A4Y2BYV2_ARAVE|nr:hypothetical protein AVEN_84950-1 [Araneus ventricosus]
MRSGRQQYDSELARTGKVASSCRLLRLPGERARDVRHVPVVESQAQQLVIRTGQLSNYQQYAKGCPQPEHDVALSHNAILLWDRCDVLQRYGQSCCVLWDSATSDHGHHSSNI